MSQFNVILLSAIILNVVAQFILENIILQIVAAALAFNVKVIKKTLKRFFFRKNGW
jgi:hypothetical protein